MIFFLNMATTYFRRSFPQSDLVHEEKKKKKSNSMSVFFLCQIGNLNASHVIHINSSILNVVNFLLYHSSPNS